METAIAKIQVYDFNFIFLLRFSKFFKTFSAIDSVTETPASTLVPTLQSTTALAPSTPAMTTLLPIGITCQFYLNNMAILSYRFEIYACVVSELLDIRSSVEVTNILGTHQDGQSNADVNYLGINSQTIFYFPQGIGNFFPNLKYINFENNKLRYITQSDLSPFVELVAVYFNRNFIETLPGDLFLSNKKLIYINFDSNNIVHVGPNLFDPIKETIEYASFNGNPCTNLVYERYSPDPSVRVISVIQDQFNTYCN